MFQLFRKLKWQREARAGAHTAITTKWENLNLERFYDIKALPEPDPRDPSTAADYDLQLVAILTGVPVDSLETMPLDDFQFLKGRAAWIKTDALPDVEERRRYVIDGPLETRVFDVTLDVNKWTASQYIDYQTLGGNTETAAAMASLLCCYLVPAGHTYGDGYDIDEEAKWLQQYFPALDAFALHNFFVARSLGSITSIKTYWGLIRAARTKKARKQIKTLIRRLRHLATSGDGSASSTQLLRSKGFLGERHLIWKLSKLSIR